MEIPAERPPRYLAARLAMPRMVAPTGKASRTPVTITSRYKPSRLGSNVNQKDTASDRLSVYSDGVEYNTEHQRFYAVCELQCTEEDWNPLRVV